MSDEPTISQETKSSIIFGTGPTHISATFSGEDQWWTARELSITISNETGATTNIYALKYQDDETTPAVARLREFLQKVLSKLPSSDNQEISLCDSMRSSNPIDGSIEGYARKVGLKNLPGSVRVTLAAKYHLEHDDFVGIQEVLDDPNNNLEAASDLESIQKAMMEVPPDAHDKKPDPIPEPVGDSRCPRRVTEEITAVREYPASFAAITKKKHKKNKKD